MTELHGKVALVTGCAHERGIGRAIARRLAAAGADLVLTDVAEGGASLPSGPSSWAGLAAVAAEIERMGRQTLTALVDVRSRDHPGLMNGRGVSRRTVPLAS